MSAPKLLLSDAQFLKGPNFAAWKTKMKTILQFEGLWGIVTGSVPAPTAPDELIKYDMASAKALMLIMLSISDDVQPHVRNAEKPKEAWDKLATIYEAKNQTKILHLQSKLHTLSMGSDEKVEEFLHRVAELRLELLALGEMVDDKLLVPITLRALPSQFRVFVTTLNVSKQTVTFEELVNLLQ